MQRIYTVKELKEFIEDLDDEIEIYLKDEYNNIRTSLDLEIVYDPDLSEENDILMVE